MLLKYAINASDENKKKVRNPAVDGGLGREVARSQEVLLRSRCGRRQSQFNARRTMIVVGCNLSILILWTSTGLGFTLLVQIRLLSSFLII